MQLPASPAIDRVKTAAITNDVAPTLRSFTLTSGATTFLPGATASFQATYLVAQADIDAGGLTNTATVVGTPPTGTSVSDVTDDGDDSDGNATNDQTVLAVTAAPAMTVKKVADDGALSDAPKAGEVIDYTITVENSGNVTLSSVTLGDELTADADEAYVSGDTNANDKLDLTETWTFATKYTLTQADIDAGKVENLAILTATPPSGSPISIESSSATDGNAIAGDGKGAPTTTTLAGSPGLSVKKTVDDSALDDGVRVGDTLLYTIEVKNTGNVTLRDVALIDDFSDVKGGRLTLTSGPASDVALTDQVLDVGEVWTFKASFVLDAATIAAGGVENLATVTGTPPDGTPISAESKVSGNSTENGEATSTGFPGEISGTVRECLAPQAGISVFLLEETSPGVYDYGLDNGVPRSVVTNVDGTY